MVDGKLTELPVGDDVPLPQPLRDISALTYAGNQLKVIRVNASGTAFELALVGGGDSANLPAVMARISMGF